MKAIIDIDNTLWNFTTIFYEALRTVNSEIPEPDKWSEYYFWKDYISDKNVYKIIDEIQNNQEMYTPFKDASKFLEFLVFEKGYYTIIASHRSLESRQNTFRWLRKNRLSFNELYVSYDKTILFEKDCIVVDDSPFVLEKAKEKVSFSVGIEYPWNRDRGFTLFNNLSEIQKCLKERRDG